MKHEGSLPCHMSQPLVPHMCQFNPLQLLANTSLKSTLILSSQLSLGLPNIFLASDLPTKILYEFIIFHRACYTSYPSYTLWFDSCSRNIWQRVQTLKFLTVSFCPSCCFLLSVMSKYSRQQIFLKQT